MNLILDWLNAHPIISTFIMSTIAHKVIQKNQSINAEDLIELLADLIIKLAQPFASKNEP